MKPQSDPIQQYLDQLENVGNDELRLFNDLDPSYYTIRHLLEVREQWIEQVHLYHRSNSVKNLLGFSTAAWLMITAFCFYMGLENYFLIICLFVSGVFTFIFLFSLFAIRNKFKSRSHLNGIGQSINSELERRGVKIPHYDYQKDVN